MLTIYSPIKSNRFYYSVKLIFSQICNIDYKITHNKSELNSNENIINYSGELIKNSFQIHPHGLLSEKMYNKFDVNFEYGGEEKVKIFTTEFDNLGYDIFSATFFLASRMEEYWQFEEDNHNRFTSKNSIMHKLGVIHLPLINIWSKALLNKLSKHFNLKIELKNKFKIINTIDIDNAWAYSNKGITRSIGGIIKAIYKFNFVEAKNRLKTIFFGAKDPYDTYSYIEKTTAKNNLESIYFFLLGNRGEYDKNISHKNKKLIKLINKLNKDNKIGIHPSYKSFKNQTQQKLEKQRLENITKNTITLSRKHYLKLSIPETYRIYIKIGIKEDYTMGYADNIGFRAGICTPFTFFDILEDKETSLKIHPFAYMDGTLNQYMNLTIEEAIQKIQQLKTDVKNVEGNFIGIWHNETLNNLGIWKGWQKVYEKAISYN